MTPDAALDEETAWALLRRARGRDVGAVLAGGDRARLDHPARAGVWLELAPSAAWSASPTPDAAARDLLDLFSPVAVAPDLVIGQLGQSLDGRIATARGHSHYVTGPTDLRRLHRLRALVDAVVVGAGTVDLDDPRLTVREVVGENPVRVVLDPEGRLGQDRRVFSDQAAPTLVVRRAGAAAPAAHLPGVSAIDLPIEGPNPLDPELVLEALRARGLRRVLVEGGGVTVSRFLQAGLLDRLHVTVAPLLIGSGRPALTLPEIESLDQALRPRCRHFRLGDDLLFDLDLR